jgi:hypothetical protein
VNAVTWLVTPGKSGRIAVMGTVGSLLERTIAIERVLNAIGSPLTTSVGRLGPSASSILDWKRQARDNAPRMSTRMVLLGVAIVAIVAAGCAVPPPALAPAPPADLKAPFTGYTSAHYADPASWICLPGHADACAANLDATDLRPDGAWVEVTERPAPTADRVDCFYVYPTVDLRPWPASHTDFSDLSGISRTTIAQAARFRNACRVFAPLYRQTTIGTYLQSDEVRRPYRDVAVSDVVDAFLHYMGQYNQGRKVVLIGHSQGAEMVVALLKRFFDDDADVGGMRERLLLALPIGWAMDVQPGQATGGTFTHIPVCTEHGQTGCVVGYRSYADGEEVKVGRAVPAPGRESVCVNPAELAHGTPVFTRSFFGKPPPPFKLVGMDGMRTPFVLVRDFYQARCVSRPGGLKYLAISVARRPGDARVSPVDLGMPMLHGVLGYHLLDVHFAEGDLVDLVSERVAALANRSGAPGQEPRAAAPNLGE